MSCSGKAEDLRGLILRVREAVIAGSAAVDYAALEAWQKWAFAEADRLDPIQSGPRGRRSLTTAPADWR